MLFGLAPAKVSLANSSSDSQKNLSPAIQKFPTQITCKTSNIINIWLIIIKKIKKKHLYHIIINVLTFKCFWGIKAQKVLAIISNFNQPGNGFLEQC